MPCEAETDVAVTRRSRYVTSDCGAVGNANYARAGWGRPIDLVTRSLSAGLDTDCGNGHDTWATSLPGLLSNGSVPMALVDTALRHLFSVQMRLGVFDAPAVQPEWARFGKEQINTVMNREVVLQAGKSSWHHWCSPEPGALGDRTGVLV